MEFIKFRGKREYGELFKSNKNIDKDFSGASPPSVFIGSNINQKILNVGILSPPERVDEAWIYDSPNYWYDNKYKIDDIASLRASLINSRFKASIYDIRKETKFLEIAKEITMSLNPVDIEINLEKKPNNENITLDKISFPSGPIAQLKNIRITSNVKINNKIEKVYGENDLKSTEAITYLYKHNFNEHTLSKLLSLGIFGLKKDRRLVPTRWGIVATIDVISKDIINNIKNYNTMENYQFYSGNYLGNYYFIILSPNIWSYELFELYLPKSFWNFSGKLEMASDYEDYYGRKNYAGNTAGGYYQPRLKLLEFLTNITKQASCLIIRFETPEYTAPLGVWVTGMGAKNALDSKPMNFNSIEDVSNYAKSEIIKRFNMDISNLLKDSILLRNFKNQTSLKQFI